tara:strand:- start:190 stop:975 length:786 start_codon:yes stop_codon:yes gene_type:complete
MEQYTINEKQETEEGNISLEEQLAQQEEAQQQQQQSPSGSEEEQQQKEEDLILGKFKSQEDLAEAYENLEKKLGEKQSQEQQTQTEDEGDTNSESNDVSNAIEDAAIAYAENGELSEANYKELEKLNITKDIVDTYIRGQQALISAEEVEITNSIGGQENYEAMAEWARNNLPGEEIDSFDQIVESSTPEAAKMAVKGLYARFLSEGGQQPNIRQGQTSGSAVQPFQSNAQVVEAMRDKRYENDPAYREEVERRLAVSTRV